MLMTRPPPSLARSAASVPFIDMIGDAPVAKQTLAAKFCTTVLVMLWDRVDDDACFSMIPGI